MQLCQKTAVSYQILWQSRSEQNESHLHKPSATATPENCTRKGPDLIPGVNMRCSCWQTEVRVIHSTVGSGLSLCHSWWGSSFKVLVSCFLIWVNKNAINHLKPESEGYVVAVSRLLCCANHSFMVLYSGVSLHLCSCLDHHLYYCAILSWCLLQICPSSRPGCAGPLSLVQILAKCRNMPCFISA